MSKDQTEVRRSHEAPLQVLCGDAVEQLRALPEASVQCCVTSPPYWGLRSYLPAGHPAKANELGQERTWEQYVQNITAVFREVHRVIRPDGTLWLNLGDCYSDSGNGGNPGHSEHVKQKSNAGSLGVRGVRRAGKKPKDLFGIPWRVAFALQDDGWWLRQWMPWVKRNGMPESAEDRPSCACETLFLLSKSRRYHYDKEAVKLPASLAFANDGRWKTGSTARNEKNGYAEAGAQNPKSVHRMFDKQRGHSRRHAGFNDRWDKMTKEEQCGGWRATRNSDWFFEGLLTDGWPLAFVGAPAQSKESHFAVFPDWLPTPCILAGTRPGDLVLDPFAGSGTTGKVALELGRRAVLVELNPEYVKLIERRCAVTVGLGL